MPEYTYTFYDIRTQQKLGTLPLYGVNCTDLLLQGGGGAGAGSFTGSIRMDSDWVTSPQEILDITRPESTAVWMDRDDQPIWCGIVWTQTYQSDGRVLQLNAQTFSSYLDSVVWDPASLALASKTVTDNPHNIIRYLYQYLLTEASEEYDIGVILEEYHQDLAGTMMTSTFARADHKYLREFADDALKAGAEYRILPMIIDGVRVPLLQSGVPNALGVTQNSADYGDPLQYPGDLSKYWLTNSASNAPTKLIGVGKATGQTEILAVQQGSTSGRIGVDKVVSYEISDQATLNLMVANDQQAAQAQLSRPVYELGGGTVDMSWKVGDYRRVVIDDPYRFPSPMSGAIRLVGWSLSPADSGAVEQQSITVDHVSNLVAVSV